MSLWLLQLKVQEAMKKKDLAREHEEVILLRIFFIYLCALGIKTPFHLT